MPPKIAILCAIEEEVRPLVKTWRRRSFRVGAAGVPVFEGPDCLAVCAGMGPEAARSAAEALLAEFRAEMLISAGFAGALVERLHVGDVLRPAFLVDEVSGEKFAASGGQGVVVSSRRVAGPERKRELAGRFGAEAVDMEGATLAQVASAHGVRWMAVKAISDEWDFPLLDFSLFTDSAGQLRRGRIAGYAVPRPWIWPQIARLAAHCRLAARELCAELEHLITKAREEELRVGAGQGRERRSH